jgi:cellulose synthase (UDP-forming)
MLVVGLWNTFNLMVAGAGLGAIAERKQPDRHPRLVIDRQGFLHAQGQAIAVQIVNVSAGGMGVKLDGALPQVFKDGDVLLTIEPLGDIVARNEPLPVNFRHATSVGSQMVYGFKFGDMQPRDYYVHADLMYADSEALPRFLNSRRKHKNLFAGTGQFLWWGLSEPVRAIAYAIREIMGAKPEADAAPQVSTIWLRRLLAMSKIGRTETPPAAASTATKAADEARVA